MEGGRWGLLLPYGLKNPTDLPKVSREDPYESTWGTKYTEQCTEVIKKLSMGIQTM